MSTFGQSTVETTGRTIQVTADGRPEFKAAGGTVDWSTITAVSGSDVTYLDGVLVKIGEKALRYGQVMTRITASGKFGPFDSAAADGRQTLARGDCYIVNETVREDDANSDHPALFDGGLVFISRVIQSGVGAHSLTAGPTLAELLAAFPRLSLVNE